MSFTSKERVLMTINYKKPDRVPDPYGEAGTASPTNFTSIFWIRLDWIPFSLSGPISCIRWMTMMTAFWSNFTSTSVTLIPFWQLTRPATYTSPGVRALRQLLLDPARPAADRQLATSQRPG